jgi:hypothetical protein
MAQVKARILFRAAQVPSGTPQRNCNQNCNQRSTPGARMIYLARTKGQVRLLMTIGGAGGARTHDRRIMSPLL